jgi:Icc-related predicted phosphoesterase
MRCLVVADLHYSLPQFDWVVNEADRFDLVILAGDHLDLGSLVDGWAQTVVVRKYMELLRAKTHVLLCSGNHDLDSRDASGEKVAKWIGDCRHANVSSDGDTVAIENTLISVCPWWDGPLKREQVAAQLAADARRRTGRWIWVHHAPADKSPTSWTGSRDSGDSVLSEWIARYRPDIVLSGHVHQSPFVKGGSWVDRIGPTLVFNTGSHSGAPPAHIIFDTTSDEAVWMSSAGIQSFSLGEPLALPLPRRSRPPEWVMSQTRPGAPTRAGIRQVVD